MDLGGDFKAILESLFGPVIGGLMVMGFGLYKWWNSFTDKERKDQEEDREKLSVAQEALMTRLQAEVAATLATKEKLRQERDLEHAWGVYWRGQADYWWQKNNATEHALRGLIFKARLQHQQSSLPGVPEALYPDYPDSPPFEVGNGRPKPS